MFKLFKQTSYAEAKTTQNTNFPKPKTVNEIIEEIHESFYTEVDKLLADAKIEKSAYTTKQSLIDKCERLKALGFFNTQEVKEAEIEIKRLDEIKSDNQAKRELVEAIDYFSFKYPNYKFITEESVKKICEKYNLVYGSIENYIGTVPDKNLKHIEEFKISEDDECYFYEYSHIGHFGKFIIKSEFHSIKNAYNLGESKSLALGYTTETSTKLPLEIAAPLKDFNTNNMEVSDFKLSKIEIPDPVVLKPVVFKSKKYYLIVTAWGIEASDELVVNQRNN